MTVAQGRSCLEGLEWSSIYGPEAGSVPTAPWQENVQPSQPRQLGYSQGVTENWRAAAQCWRWGAQRRRGRGRWWVRNKVFYIIFGTARTWHFLCSTRKPNTDWWRGPHVCVGLRWLRQVCLEGPSSIFNHYNTFLRCEFMAALQCLSAMMNVKGWNWIRHLSPQRKLNGNHSLPFV